MAGKKWLKLWTETLHDRKLRRVTPSWRWCWVGLLMLAAETDDAGRLHLAATEPLTDEDIADELGVDLTDWTLARDYFTRIGMLHREGASLVVTNYVKRQEPADPTAAERMRNMRDRKRDKTVTVTDVTRNVTEDVTRTLRVEAEADTEAETESVNLYNNSSSVYGTAPTNGYVGGTVDPLLFLNQIKFKDPEKFLGEVDRMLVSWWAWYYQCLNEHERKGIHSWPALVNAKVRGGVKPRLNDRQQQAFWNAWKVAEVATDA